MWRASLPTIRALLDISSLGCSIFKALPSGQSLPHHHCTVIQKHTASPQEANCCVFFAVTKDLTRSNSWEVRLALPPSSGDLGTRGSQKWSRVDGRAVLAVPFPFHSIWDLSPQEWATHIQVGLPYFLKQSSLEKPSQTHRRCASSTPQSLLIQAVCRIFLVITVTDPGFSQAHYQLTERPPSSLLSGWGSCLSSLWARRHKQKDPWGFQKHAFYNGDIALSSISLFCCMGHRDIPKATGQRLEKLCS